jgi:hypothetical protein
MQLQKRRSERGMVSPGERLGAEGYSISAFYRISTGKAEKNGFSPV